MKPNNEQIDSSAEHMLRVISIGDDRYMLADSLSDEEVMKLMLLMRGMRRVKRDFLYITSTAIEFVEDRACAVGLVLSTSRPVPEAEARVKLEAEHAQFAQSRTKQAVEVKP